MIQDYLLFFLIGFAVFYFTTGNRECQSFFIKLNKDFFWLSASDSGST